MEKLRTQAARKYRLLTCYRFWMFTGHKEYEESLILILTNEGGSISFAFTDLTTNQTTSFENPSSGEYVIPLQKSGKMKLIITANKAIGAYKIVKKTIKP